MLFTKEGKKKKLPFAGFSHTFFNNASLVIQYVEKEVIYYS